jgi:hypothetical protein
MKNAFNWHNTNCEMQVHSDWSKYTFNKPNIPLMMFVTTGVSCLQRSSRKEEYTVCSSCKLASRSKEGLYFRISTSKSSSTFNSTTSFGNSVITAPS